MRLFTCVALFASCCTTLWAEELTAEVEVEYVRSATIRYVVDTPEGYDEAADEQYPLVLFLHGAGERGDDLSRVKVHGPHSYVKEHSVPVILVSPQCDGRSWWDADALLALVDHLQETYPVDRSRIYVTGLSMGGFGTWAMIQKDPERFAAAVPICGGGAPEEVDGIKDLPIWVFHGDNDAVVPESMSQEMVEALQAAGSDVKYTVYPDTGHDSWTETYNDPEVYEWLLAQRKDSDR